MDMRFCLLICVRSRYRILKLSHVLRKMVKTNLRGLLWWMGLIYVESMKKLCYLRLPKTVIFRFFHWLLRLWMQRMMIRVNGFLPNCGVVFQMSMRW
ncbi:unnamed protein product [Brassica oleracea var. botrytis]